MPINPELLDELLKEYKSPDDMFGTDGLLQQLTKVLVERAMQAEISHHLGYEKNSSGGKNTGNSRNGSFPKTIKGRRGQVRIDVPRDRAGEFQIQIIIACVDGLKGFPEAIETIFPKTQVQLCMVHLMRNSLAYVSYKDRKFVASGPESGLQLGNC
jgi:transposase-like protein